MRRLFITNHEQVRLRSIVGTTLSISRKGANNAYRVSEKSSAETVSFTGPQAPSWDVTEQQ
jgi:hypothetical protein